MVEQIVAFLTEAVSRAATLSAFVYNKTGTWPLVFAGISIVLITRFLLGPILGITMSGASDMVRKARRSKDG